MDDKWEAQVRARINAPHFLYTEEGMSVAEREKARNQFITQIWNNQQSRLEDGADESVLDGSKSRFEDKQEKAENQLAEYQVHVTFCDVFQRDIRREAYRLADERGVDPTQNREKWEDLLETPIGEHFLTLEKQNSPAHYRWEFTPAYPMPWDYHSPEAGLDKYSTDEGDADRPVVGILYQPSTDYLGARIDGVEYIQPRERRMSFSSADSWTEVLEKVQERKKTFAAKKQECECRIAKATCQIQVIDIMLDWLDEGKKVKPMGEPVDLPSDDEENSSTKSLTPEGWEKNAALMHAYVSEYGMPDYLKDFEDLIPEKTGLDSFSHEHTWKKLKAEGYAVSARKEDLPATLEGWAEEFEEEYGIHKAVAAAKPLQWPLPFDDE
jgi:aryl carrier-like protein